MLTVPIKALTDEFRQRINTHNQTGKRILELEYGDMGVLRNLFNQSTEKVTKIKQKDVRILARGGNYNNGMESTYENQTPKLDSITKNDVLAKRQRQSDRPSRLDGDKGFEDNAKPTTKHNDLLVWGNQPRNNISTQPHQTKQQTTGKKFSLRNFN
jgi:hypothetical protein